MNSIWTSAHCVWCFLCSVPYISDRTCTRREEDWEVFEPVDAAHGIERFKIICFAKTWEFRLHIIIMFVWFGDTVDMVINADTIIGSGLSWKKSCLTFVMRNCVLVNIIRPCGSVYTTDWPALIYCIFQPWSLVHSVHLTLYLSADRPKLFMFHCACEIDGDGHKLFCSMLLRSRKCYFCVAIHVHIPVCV